MEYDQHYGQQDEGRGSDGAKNGRASILNMSTMMRWMSSCESIERCFPPNNQMRRYRAVDFPVLCSAANVSRLAKRYRLSAHQLSAIYARIGLVYWRGDVIMQ